MSNQTNRLFAEISKVLGKNFYVLPIANPQDITFRMENGTCDIVTFERKLYEMFLNAIDGGADCTNFSITRSPIQGKAKGTCTGTARAFEEGHYSWRPRMIVAVATPYSNIEAHFTLGLNLTTNKTFVSLAFVDLKTCKGNIAFSIPIAYSLEDFMNMQTPLFVHALKTFSKANAEQKDELSNVAQFAIKHVLH